MKTTFLFLLITLGFSVMSFGQNTYVPDDNFEQALIDLGYDNVLDDYVLTANISSVTTLDVGNRNIADLTGIEGFVALSNLRCHGNQLTSLNISNNSQLLLLGCSHNSLTDLDVSGNSALKHLYCGYNQLTSLDISNNSALISLECSNLQLIILDVTSNSLLTLLWCSYNQLTTIDVSNNVLLEGLWCSGNELTNINLDNNLVLYHLQCDNNQINNLDVSNLPLLQTLYCPFNRLTSLDVSNNTAALMYIICNDNELINLNVKNGFNHHHTYNDCFDARNNPNLTCIQVDNAALSTTNWTNIDPQMYFSENCNNSLTYVPDNNFEQALIDLGYDNVLDDYVLTANISAVTTLDVNNKFISNLTGIEDFAALLSIDCSQNQLTSLNISNNTLLRTLECAGNHLSNLDVSNNTLLITLSCGGNQLTSLNVSNNTALTNLKCSQNQLASLNVSNNTALTNLDCSQNQLTSLNVTNNTALTDLKCSQNQLAILNVSNNTALTNLECSQNQLSSLDVSNNTLLMKLGCADNQLTTLDVANNTLLWQLMCGRNQITELSVSNMANLVHIEVSSNPLGSLDLTNNVSLIEVGCVNSNLTSLKIDNCVSLKTIHCQYNQITSLDVSTCPSLIYLGCYNNQLTSIDVSNNPLLTSLGCFFNKITHLDVSNNIHLDQLGCNNNLLESLNVRNGNNINFTYFTANSNPNLTCIQVDNAAWSEANWTQIDPQMYFSEFCNGSEPLHVTQPNTPGIRWNLGSTYDITWNDNITDPVNIHLYNGINHTYSPIGWAIENNIFHWNIPNNTPIGDQYKIKISSVSNPALYDLSDNSFSIVAANNNFFVNVIQPSASGLIWNTGENYLISWTDNLSQNVKIDLINDATNITTPIAASVPGSTYSWHISEATPNGTQYKIRISSVTGIGTQDLSDNYFEITDTPASTNIVIMQPTNSGITWLRGSSYLISWTDNVPDNNVSIILCNAAGNNIATLKSNAPGSTWVWTVPASIYPPGAYKIKIAYKNASGISANPFTISDSPEGAYINILQPNLHGITWLRGSTYLISWDDNIPGTVDIFYERTSNPTEVPIATNVSGSTFAWTIPQITPASDYWITIRSHADASKFGMSENPFAISDYLPGGSIDINQPNGGEIWTKGNSYLISWDDNFTENVKIELVNYATSTTIILAASLPGSTWAWTIPNTSSYPAGVLYKMKISSTQNPAVFAESDNYFTITDQVLTAVVYPNPANRDFNLQFSEEISGNYTLSFSNRFNMVVMSRNINVQDVKEINVSTFGLNDGVYVLTIASENVLITKKVIIQNY